jgi:hypothetical protein
LYAGYQPRTCGQSRLTGLVWAPTQASVSDAMNAQTPKTSSTGASPVMAQFFEAKARQPDALVFFRMGDFYELFFEDAAKASAALGITLTARGQHGGAPIPMCGVPVHAAEAYLAKLIRAGFKVAVCEQMENPAEARKRGSKSVVRRDVVRVVTPGTLTEDGLLDARGANRWRPSRCAPAQGGGGQRRALHRRGRVPGVAVSGWPRRWRRCSPRRSWSPTGCSPTRRSRRP